MDRSLGSTGKSDGDLELNLNSAALLSRRLFLCFAIEVAIWAASVAEDRINCATI